MKSINKQELHNIFKGIANKEENEFNKLYEKYNKLVYRISFSILKNKENSEDITQTVFTKIWNMNTNNLPTNSEASWLYTITKNETLNFLRKQKNALNLEDIYYINNDNNELNEIIEKDTFNRIITKLNEKEQEIVSLKILSGLSFKAISQILNMPIGTVQWKYYKSLHTLETLISSVSLYIITIVLFITQKEVNMKKKAASENENTEAEAPTIKEENNYLQKDKEDETQKSELPNARENIIQSEKVIEESIQTNEIKEETVEEIRQQNNNINMYDIGILGISSILLVITIIFTHIFRKHQQNLKKKASK
ncbi:MAG: sigma-70 family RNA polymerase sigma factor [Clostridia bacterium]|nr:sigma-70 family RNA polymerase sigma factor [Clostridia bacterium]